MNQPPTCETLPSTGGWPGEVLLCVFCHRTVNRVSPHAAGVPSGLGLCGCIKVNLTWLADLLAEVERLGVTL